MPDRCAVYGCSNQASLENNVSVHRIPFLNDDRVEAKKRRKKWVDFVMTTREKEDLTLKKYCARLLRDEIGILAYPTLHLKHKTKKEPLSRDKRMQKRNVITSLASHSEQPHTKKSKGEQHPTVCFDENEHLDEFCDENFLVEGPSTQLKDVEVQCCLVDKSTRHYKNMWATAKYKLQRCRNELKKCKVKLGYIGRLQYATYKYCERGHQREKLFPAILLHWKKYQSCMIEQLKSSGKQLVIAGDGRHDSMGHSAKYCAYSVFCCTVPNIIDFSIVQKNEVGNSPAMEYEGFKRSMDNLLKRNIPISTFVSDRHTSIAKHMREKHKNITHYFDLWHLIKKVSKVLKKIEKESGCEAISQWIKPCTNHLFWSVTTTFSGHGLVMLAKFKSFFSHIINRHSELPDRLFTKFAHDSNIQDRKWLDEDSITYIKMHAALTKRSLVPGIKKASPLEQTSCLEGFHSVLNQFSPKMLSYSYPGMFARHALAVIHFNINLKRYVKEINGVKQVKLVYPKFKNGEAVVRNVTVKPNFNYVEEIYQTTLCAIRYNTLNKAEKGLKLMTPLPMSSMLNKQSKDEAIQKHSARKAMTTIDVPPTNPVQEAPVSQDQTTGRAKPHCSICKQPMKGHKNVANCPKNQK
ncbi:PREDICTED: uncharacterized protein LOC107342022 [Paramuricea clavata]|uniref:PREDICTED: uncharacterized protein LOC107342022 n=1 Tax=Paramuricea clavata TaxID=317549 RepID=A0A7D9HDQ6_PARCT|nr:PREDICTED: uncharacterized protein LOC107342022 [Paramuricea clavata]